MISFGAWAIADAEYGRYKRNQREKAGYRVKATEVETHLRPKLFVVK
jgi:hypothetical protein